MWGFFKKTRKYLQDLSIKWKLILIYCLVGVIPIVGLSAAMVSSTCRSMMELEEKQLKMQTQTIKNNLFSMTLLYYEIGRTIQYDEEMKKLLCTQYETEKDVYMAYRKCGLLDTYISHHMEIADINMYFDNGTMFDYGRFHMVTSETQKESWYQQARASAGIPFWYYGSVGKGKAALSLIQYVNYPVTKSYGITVIQVSDNYLSTMLGNPKFQYMVGLDFDVVIAASDSKDINGEIPFQINGKSGISEVYYPEYHGKNVMAADFSLYGVNTNNQFQVIVIDDCLNDIMLTVRRYIPILLIVLSVPLFLIIVFSIWYGRRLMSVRDEMHKIAGGDLTISDFPERGDELGEVLRDMKTTIYSIKELQEQIYQSRLDAKELENEQQQIQFELLASQINPHFLFNTLESIRMQAALDGNQKLTKIIMQLGRILRFSLENKRKQVSLSEELKYIEAYFDIQKFRFQDKIACCIYIQPNLNVEKIMVLPLLLQPLAENSLIHAFPCMKKGSWINIKIRSKSRLLMMEVSDNGTGISEERFKELKDKMQHEKSEPGRSIGICNVHKRIQLFYGEKYGIDISSQEGEGTSVLIRIPLPEGD